MAFTPKENFLAVLNHQKGEWIPSSLTDSIMVGFGMGANLAFEKGPIGGGYDGFGVRWVTPASGGGAPIPAPNEFILDSDTIVDWKKIVKFPDVSNYDWETAAKEQLSKGNPDLQIVDFGSGNGPFERLAALMGFEEALIALVEEPEATYELLDAIVDYKIQTMEKAQKYFKADTFTNYDDIATERNPFMSPSVYREIIKPIHTKLYDAVKSYDMIPIQHTCGKAEELVEDFIDTGIAAWTSVQPTNDIADILKKYGDKLTIMGGYDTNGYPGREDAPPEVIRAEVRRAMDAYGKYPGYVFFGFLLVSSDDQQKRFELMRPLIEESVSYARLLAEKN
ncbi:uroporphyrinogen decarboxylase family protein [Acetobacterium sp. UBA5834]|jgi:hypothetical protein|uniref:uroporphyrinogen decarboxylase family protein n=1 Tax=Acetobacterium sp. UBA5834 TaxID=1945907 RepID=UPI00258064CF|nr:uroporphyrinogen decarboxylase family protein [Acetobacterium sp. UBA5834]